MGLSARTAGELLSELQDVQLIIVDEVSMVGFQLLRELDMRLRELFDQSVSFGGKHVVLVGDFFQLRPVQDVFCFEPTSSTNVLSPFNTLWSEFRLYELTNIMRQREHLIFAQLLNRLREGTHSPEDIKLITSLSATEHANELEQMHLFSTNKKVNKFNTTLYTSVPTSSQSLVMANFILEGTNRLVQYVAPKGGASRGETFTAGLVEKLEIFVGCIVMICRNTDTADGLVNGATGVVKLVSSLPSLDAPGPIQPDMHSVIWVEFPQQRCGAICRSKASDVREMFGVKNVNWTPIVRIRSRCPTLQKGRNVVISQFPMVHRNASTIHKTQSLTLSGGVVDLGGYIQPGMVYVALSRFSETTSLKIVNFGIAALTTCNKVKVAMSQMREAPMSLSIQPMFTLQNRTECSFYQNVNGLNTSLSMLSAMEGFTDLDMYFFVETKLENPVSQYPALSQKLATLGQYVFELPYRYGGLLIISKSKCTLEYMDISNLAHVEILLVRKGDIQYCLVYKHPNTIVATLRQHLDKVPLVSGKVVFVGDFNIDMLKFQQRAFTRYMMSRSCLQYVTMATHRKGALIDHVWANFAPTQNPIHVESYMVDHFPIIMQWT